TGLRWTAVALTLAALVCLGGGVVAGDLWARWPEAAPPGEPVSLSLASRGWADARGMIADFPLVGTRLGGFAPISPYYKSEDAATTTALSSALQWWVESGVTGLALLGLAVLWCLARLPAAVRRVGTADRSLVFGLIGAAASFTLFSLVHWTVELP